MRCGPLNSYPRLITSNFTLSDTLCIFDLHGMIDELIVLISYLNRVVVRCDVEGLVFTHVTEAVMTSRLGPLIAPRGFSY